MKGKRTYQIWLIYGISCVFVILPCVGYGADLTIGNNVSTTGTVSATSFTGNGSGLTNLDPTKLSSGTANISISGNAATVTNGLYSSGTYANPSWITSLSPGKLIPGGTANINILGNAATATTANSVVAGGVVTTSLVNGAVTTGKLSDNAVTRAKIAFYKNVAVVATNGGDYPDPATAMNNYGSWCGAPSYTNPCLLKIMPGFYIVSSPVVMQPFIDIEGSGENTTTIISSLVSSTFPPPGTVQGADNTELRFLTVSNSTNVSSAWVAAISNVSASPSILHVKATAVGGSQCYGVVNSHSSSTMTNVSAAAQFGTNNYGILNVYSDSSPMMTNVTASAADGTDNNYGIYNDNTSSPILTNVTASTSRANSNYGIYNAGGSPTMTNVESNALVGNDSYGIYNSTSSPVMTNVTAKAVLGLNNNYGIYNSGGSPTMTNVNVSASGGTSNYGVYNPGSGTTKISHSVIKGSTNTIWNGSGNTTRVIFTQLAGGPIFNVGTLSCGGVCDGNYTFYANTCP